MVSNREPAEILEDAYQQAKKRRERSFITDQEIRSRIAAVSRSRIGAGVRLILACSLAKVHDPSIDIRKPYTELEGNSYSGRTYDEQYVTEFVNRYELPCNPTTAFLTPALRTKNVILEPGINLGGRDKGLYHDAILLLNDVENGRIKAEDLLKETVRNLLELKRIRSQRISSLLDELKQTEGITPLSAEDIVNLIEQHFKSPNASRLPVLVVAAAYKAASDNLGERALPLQAHTAADKRTGALGDIEIALVDDNEIVTAYEMKMKKITKDDIDRALQKLRNFGGHIDNYIFVTTDVIDLDVAEYARSLYRETAGIEFVILDCIGFLRHFLHLFHRLRLEFLECYQELLLDEPESAVRQPLKESFLALRQAAESSYSQGS